jgi:phospholipid transport system transporter-binding protein
MVVDADSIVMENAAAVAQAGLAAIARGDTQFDLAAVRRCDSSAVAVLLEWQRAAAARGATLDVRGAPAAIASLAGVYGVETLLPALGR